MVKGWAQDNSTNGGLTLSGAGTPVLFASPQGAGGASPSLMPYLDVTYAPSAASGGFNDINGPNKVMYGVSGSFSLTGDYGQSPEQPPALPKKFICLKASCGGNMGIHTVASTLGGSILRFSVNAFCPPDTTSNPSPYNVSYWSGLSATHGDFAGNGQQRQNVIAEILANIYSEHLTPIITFLAGNSAACENYLGYVTSDHKTKNPNYAYNWQQEMQSFVAAMQQAPTNLSSPSGETVGQALTDGRHFTYFEIGNEPDINSKSYFGTLPGDNNNYPPIFAAAASGLYTALNGTAAKSAYRVITAGMVEPSIKSTGGGPFSTPNNYTVAKNAINDATSGQVLKTPVAGDQKVPYGNLGFGVHPYNYATQNPDPYGYTGYWRNFYYLYCVNGGGIQPHTPPIDRTTCNHYNRTRQLDRMIRLWSTPIHGQPLPVVFTETNWSDEPNTVKDSAQACSNPTGCQAAYLVDLFTYLDDYCKLYYRNSCEKGDFSRFPVRVAWYRGADKAEAQGSITKPPVLGLYVGARSPKSAYIRDCVGRGPQSDTLGNFYHKHRRIPCY
jgi:hypothetical protein